MASINKKSGRTRALSSKPWKGSALIFLLCLLAAIAAHHYSLNETNNRVEHHLERKTDEIALLFARESSEKLRAMNRLAETWHWVRTEAKERWQILALQLIEDFPFAFQAIEYAGTDFVISKVAPLEENKEVLGLNIANRPLALPELQKIAQ